VTEQTDRLTTALTGRTNMPLYDATKFGVLSLTRSLAATYGKDGIRINAVCPSLTLTEFHFKKAAAEGISPQQLKERHKGYGLLGRPGEPEEIAAAIHFMASKDASFITGQYLIVDGGFSIGSNDLTQLTLGVDRDSDIVAFDFDERDPGMLEMFRQAVVGAKRNGRHVGICGEAPANYPEIARYLTQLGIDSISVNPSSVFRTMAVVLEAETSPAKIKA
jgi:hypothetical protein